ncbi:MAG: succinoglycan biosynthesis protein [Hyphomicrobium sp.]|nr:MAG: succinoglycan biosynthesis protein [Hyphomicrobium sp.]PPC98538.1 MAG: succinoglycan biosynthesis protein [Hyphomicrobium sp.]
MRAHSITLLPALIIGAQIAIAAPLPDGNAIVTGKAAVVDGDTIDVGSIRIRLHGIDTPERGQLCPDRIGGGTWRCGIRATEHLASIADSKNVSCTIRDRDIYKRPVSVCTIDGKEINARMVRDGYAWAFVKYSKDYVADEADARLARIGIWQSDQPPVPPWDYRAQRWQLEAQAAPRPGCPIKGNINNDGERIYHPPWSHMYARTMVNEAKGERWFCDEGEAELAGWRAPSWR